MALVRGPFDLTWNGNTLTNIETIATGYAVDSTDYKTVQHQTFELDGPIKADVTLTLLATDVPALAVVLPQFWVANGGVLSTGENVNNAEGAIDVAAASCDEAPVYGDLFINSCATPGHMFRLVNARTRLESIEYDDKIRKVTVKFIGEPAPGEANVQFYTDGNVTGIS